MRVLSRSTIAAVILAVIGSGALHAQTSFVSGLGQQWPNATDVSASPHYHVYLFDRSGTRYIQVNDASGTVRGAFARTAYSLVGLPVGSDASRLATPDQPMAAPASTAGETVYDDGRVKVFVAPQADGTAQLMAVGSDCKNPVECSGKSP